MQLFTTSWGLDPYASAYYAGQEAVGVGNVGRSLLLAAIDNPGTWEAWRNACQAGLDVSSSDTAAGIAQCIDNLNPFGANGLRGQLHNTWKALAAGCGDQAAQGAGALLGESYLALAGGASAAGKAGQSYSGIKVGSCRTA